MRINEPEEPVFFFKLSNWFSCTFNLRTTNVKHMKPNYVTTNQNHLSSHYTRLLQFSSVQSLRRVQLFVTPWITAHQASLSITNSQILLKLMPIESWCYPAILSSVVHFSCPQTLPASGSFPMSQLFAWSGQSIGVSASASVPPMNTQDWSPS